MKPASVLLLCTAALLPPALLAQNVDVGIAWDPPLPDTVIIGTMVTPIVRATNHSAVPTSFLLVLNYPHVTRESMEVNNLPGESSAAVAFSPVPMFDSARFLSYLVISGDTNPANDTIRHTFVVHRPGIDVGIGWDSIPPDTVMPYSWHVLHVGIKNHSDWTHLGTLFIAIFQDSVVIYVESRPLMLAAREHLRLTESVPGGWRRWAVAFAGDTNPVNDTLWWRPVMRSGVSERNSSSVSQLGLGPLPTHFSRQVTIPCREPAPVHVYDACGNLVRTLAPAREVVWDGRDQLGRDLAPGIYLIVTPSPSFSPPEGERDRVRRHHASRVLKVILAR